MTGNLVRVWKKRVTRKPGRRGKDGQSLSFPLFFMVLCSAAIIHSNHTKPVFRARNRSPSGRAPDPIQLRSPKNEWLTLRIDDLTATTWKRKRQSKAPSCREPCLAKVFI